MPLSDFFSISLTDLPGLAGAGYLLYAWWQDRRRELVVSVSRTDGTHEDGSPMHIHHIAFASRGVSLSPADFLSRIDIRPPLYDDVDTWIGHSVAGDWPLPPLGAEIAGKLHTENIDKLLALEPFTLEPGERFEIELRSPRGTSLSRPLRIDTRFRSGIRVRRIGA
ncbi:MAG TPA: hypothetical protein PK765_05125 [bacterium]|nr:hypothetical protein [bacterium]